jgi:hypothetical protein
MVINGEINRLKGGLLTPLQQKQGQPTRRQNELGRNKKCTAMSYSTEQLKEVVRMTRKKAMEDAKARYEVQVEVQAQAELNAIQINENANHVLEKMSTMELFINDLMDSDESDAASDMEEEEEELMQAKLEVLCETFSM